MITIAALVLGGFLLPPARFDHVPSEPYKLIRVSRELFDAACRNYEPNEREILGCNFGRVVFIRTDLTPAAYQMVLRHEFGHLNGWAGTHPGGITMERVNEKQGN